jgi:hypothetical protein
MLPPVHKHDIECFLLCTFNYYKSEPLRRREDGHFGSYVTVQVAIDFYMPHQLGMITTAVDIIIIIIVCFIPHFIQAQVGIASVVWNSITSTDVFPSCSL